MPIELPHSGTDCGSGAWVRMKANVAAPASASVSDEADRIQQSRSSVHLVDDGSIVASTSSGWWITRSGPSATMSS